MLLGVGEEAQHVGVAVEDAGAGGQQAAHAHDVGFQARHFVGAEHDGVDHAVRHRLLLKRRQPRYLACRGRHDELPALPVADPALAQVRVQQVLTLHAQPCLERVGAVVDTRVDDLAVPRRRARANARRRFQDVHGGVARHREGPRARQAHRPGPHDDRGHVFTLSQTDDRE